jgi:hypothetical protein
MMDSKHRGERASLRKRILVSPPELASIMQAVDESGTKSIPLSRLKIGSFHSLVIEDKRVSGCGSCSIYIDSIRKRVQA